MKPYFHTHSVGWLFLLAVICFFGMEIIQFFRQRHWRRNATRIGPRSFWVGVLVWAVTATVILHRAGHIAPASGDGTRRPRVRRRHGDPARRCRAAVVVVLGR